ncbi:MAG: glycoside hydrolase family 3 C-terminal domain-containing protein [Anaerolineales bacterium]|nr:glycoside hydrolase family 3 C-terminal domain-containing protein [Anaerolineales bacterium]
MKIENLIGQKLLFAFKGKQTLSPEIITAFKKYRPSGITLFRPFNVGTLEELKNLNVSLQTLARELDLPLLLIATDQEGGQLMAVGDGTPLPGNMALGATRSKELARKAGQVLGRELAALGINVNYAPCADVNINPQNPVVGVRSFGEDPKLVAELSSAMIEGMQSQGVAATVKHFPGHGDTDSDSHHTLGTVSHSLKRLHAVELIPFISAINADAKLMMTAHLGITSIDGENPPPATLSKNILTKLLRDELDYQGVIITDAMDMHAIRQGGFLGDDSVLAVQAGADILLVTTDPQDQARIAESLLSAGKNGKLDIDDLKLSYERIIKLKKWLAEKNIKPELSVIRSVEHLAIADEIAEKSITLVRDEKNLLPLSLDENKKIAVIVPKPLDLTPADTSSYVTPQLANSIRHYHHNTDEFIVSYSPEEQERNDLIEKLKNYDLIVIGTINAYAEKKQADLVNQILNLNIPTIVIAMRLPYDLAVIPQVSTFLCTYSILEPSMKAVAKAIFGRSQITGQLPVSIPKSG